MPVVVLILVAAGTASGWLATRSSGGATGLCMSSQSGLQKRSIPKAGMTEAAVVLTNFRFGTMDDFYGLASRVRWPAHGIMIAISNEGPDATPRFRHGLRVTAGDFQGLEGLTWPAAQVAIRSRGRVITAWVEVRTVTPASIATVNRALADVHTCRG